MKETVQNNEIKFVTSPFLDDVINGLKRSPKRLSSKYFYDAQGDKIFQEIMKSPEYYPTRCETEIFSKQTSAIGQAFSKDNEPYDIIELGAGDASKTKFLLEHLLLHGVNFEYQPIDISENIINFLNTVFPKTVSGLQVKGISGDYFDMLDFAMAASQEKRKIILFLGGNIGNMKMKDVKLFCLKLRDHMKKGDLLLLGMDLKKDPKKILAAYNDKAGVTKRFNLNLLTRINRELNGNFDLDNFEHFPTYNPQSGSCRSYLISKKDHIVKIGSEIIHFQKDESIFTEVSQKFSNKQIKQLALKSGFKMITQFSDSKNWFTDALWQAE
jgi:L-histidine Nalpha-methyltransferase